MELRSVRPALPDLALAGALVCLAEIHALAGSGAEPKSVLVPAGLVIAGAVAWRRRAPLAAVACAMVAVVVQSVLASPPQALWLIVTWVVLFYSAAAELPRGTAFAALAIGLAGAAVDEIRAADRSTQGFLFALLALVALPWLAGAAVRRREGIAAHLERRASALESSRDEAMRIAVHDERSRIARDLHDMVAHAVSVIVLQAEAADAVLDVEPSRTREQLASIQRTGRQALSEMTRLLGILRDDSRPDLTPQPRTAELATLVGEVRAAGLNVELRIEGNEQPLEPGIDLTVYRIVQEALTNSLKHAGPSASACVVLRYGPGTIVVDIQDDGSAPSKTNGGGHGLIGMRERVALYGGTLRAAPRPSGGFEVNAVLPLEAAPR